MFILVFLITIVILVVIHEFGHFIAAKRFNIKVLEFGFGLPPRVWGKKIGETIWSLNWLPFGGFVRLLGEDESDKEVLDKKRSFANQKVSKRIIVVVAGVFMNLLLAWVLYYIVLGAQNFKEEVPLFSEHKFVGVEQKDVVINVVASTQNLNVDLAPGDRVLSVNGVMVQGNDQFIKEAIKAKDNKLTLGISDFENKNTKEVQIKSLSEPRLVIGNVSVQSPAANAGLKMGEKIIAINDQKVTSLSGFIEKVKAVAGEKITLTVNSQDEKSSRKVDIVPRKNPPVNQGALGVSLEEEVISGLRLGFLKIAELNYQTPVQKAFSGVFHSYNLASYSWEILSNTLAVSFQKRDFTPVSNTVAGPVGITNLVKQILEVKNPLIPYLSFMAALSLNLAVVNILPFPGLDGGRFFFLVVEAITRKKAHPTLEKYIHTLGLVFLLSLIVLITISDIRKLFL